jgi:predicted nucleic acid-binding protein
LIHFLDASALVKRYVSEPGSEAVRALFRGRRRLGASAVSLVEVTAALFRRWRAGELTPEVARGGAPQVALDLEEFELVEVRPPVLAFAAELVVRHPLRAYDAIQLACAVRLARSAGVALTFVCADRDLLTAAVAEGLKARRTG